MKEMEYLEELTSRYPVLEAVKGDVLAAYEILRDCYAGGGKLMIAGNGGSCADSEHIVGELMKGFVKRRPVSNEFAAALQEADEKRGEELASSLQGGLPAIDVYKRQVQGYLVNYQQKVTTLSELKETDQALSQAKDRISPVSYTHLDVYKRQPMGQ